ncbi:MAG: hypothetical protein V1926_02465 [Candidatus Peregrinibacteria bacterium]
MIGATIFDRLDLITIGPCNLAMDVLCDEIEVIFDFIFPPLHISPEIAEVFPKEREILLE